MRTLLVPMLLLALLAPAVPPGAATESVATTVDAVYIDAAGNPHPASFTYEGPCDGLGTATVRLLDTGDVLSAAVLSQTSGGSCGRSALRCRDCPPVPTASTWELTGLGVVLAGGGPAVYDTYQNHPLGYSLSGKYIGGVLTAWNVVTLDKGVRSGVPVGGDACVLEIVGPDLVHRTCLAPGNIHCPVYSDRWGKEGAYMGRTCHLP